MSSAYPFLLSLLSLIFLLSIASGTPITLSLYPSSIPTPVAADPWQKLNHFAAASLSRAHQIKLPTTKTSATKAPLSPRGYGGYSVSLSFGTPPQSLPFVMDTGSSLVWFPCTRRYACASCNFVNVNPANISVFVPKSSSSAKILGCKNPKCRWLFPGVECKQCPRNSTSCKQLCPAYIIQYGAGSTTGLLLSETLSFPGKSVNNFVAGCSLFSSRQPEGIAGFGRGPESLPVQMGLKKFSYCLVSHRFDDTPKKSDLILTTVSNPAGNGGDGFQYTPFTKNPVTKNPAFRDYYYVTIRKIMVGGVPVKIPYKYMVPGADGNGGTIVDSGTTFTVMDAQAYEMVAKEFEKQVGRNYSRNTQIEKKSGLRPCFNVFEKKVLKLPQLIFHFKGGAKMVLPLSDYYSFLGDSVVCMTIVSNGVSGQGVPHGPSIILGNYQQQNFDIEYDLENERLGFRRQICK